MLKLEPHWTPGSGQWADEPLWVVQRFVNTRDVELGYAGEEELTHPGALKEFLVRYAGLPESARVTTRDLDSAIELREALRSLLVANTGHRDVDPAAVETVNRAAERASLCPRIAPDGGATFKACASSDVNAALGRVVAIAFAAMHDGTWARLKVCPRETCAWAFYDRSKNRSGTWCSMRVCGNREKVRAYRERHASRG